MRKAIYTVLFLLGNAVLAFSQSKNLDKADQLFDQMSYPAAIEAYQKAIEDVPTSGYAFTRLADCYRLTDDFRSALRWYAKAVKMKGVEGEVWFHYGEVLMINRKYQEAIPWLEKYQKKSPGDDRVAEMIASCQNQEAFAANRSLFLVRRLNINSEASDFGPAFLGKSVVFASSRKRTLTKYNRTGESFLDFYVAAYAGKAELAEPSLFRGSLNTPLHEANACFSPDGKEMYFTRNFVVKGQAKTGTDDVVQLALYHATLIEGKWENEEILPFSEPSYSNGHPALSPDGQQLYFVSNRPGGAGGTDLYVVQKQGGSWGQPENLGKDINTQGNEMFPWVDAQGKLYFASNGRGGVGGLDVFQADPQEDVIASPINLGAPINSPYDDFGFILDDAAGVAFFTSNRLGGKGDDDLYAAIKLQRWETLVVDSLGAPLPDVLVDLREGRSRTQTTTDENGKFVLGLKPGASYLLFLKLPGKKDARIEFKGNALPEGVLRMENM